MAEHSTVVTSAVRPDETALQVIAAFERDRRGFHPVSGLRPKYFGVGAELEVADRALQLLVGAKTEGN
ncbi:MULTISPECIES: hypothetical protein [unclassified Mycolicibacterium]|uniref:hypothetical protein n=1 Tax=unclassified Mycolicibacterium TaxID=2636767 RepID=UPI002ED82765